jgi:hypothetical protein
MDILGSSGQAVTTAERAPLRYLEGAAAREARWDQEEQQAKWRVEVEAAAAQERTSE